MKPIQELYKEFIEKLRALIDSQVNMSRVEFKTTKRYLHVVCLRDGQDNVVYRAQYGHHGSDRRVRMHFSDVRWLQRFVYMAIWKNPTYSTLRNAFKKHDALEIVKEAQRKAKRKQTLQGNDVFWPVKDGVSDKPDKVINIRVTKEHGGHKFVMEN